MRKTPFYLGRNQRKIIEKLQTNSDGLTLLELVNYCQSKISTESRRLDCMLKKGIIIKINARYYLSEKFKKQINLKYAVKKASIKQMIHEMVESKFFEYNNESLSLQTDFIFFETLIIRLRENTSLQILKEKYPKTHEKLMMSFFENINFSLIRMGQKIESFSKKDYLLVIDERKSLMYILDKKKRLIAECHKMTKKDNLKIFYFFFKDIERIFDSINYFYQRDYSSLIE